MLSILIPAYNFDVSPLIEELQHQAEILDEAVEIIVFDDHSEYHRERNRKVAKKFNLKYQYLEQNLGRSKIRNLLSQHANFEFILFLDGDVLPKSKLFLKNYISEISPKTEVIYGGRQHEFSRKDKNKLRWKYGIYKEDKSVKTRQKKPYLSVITNNLLINKSLFLSIKFEESLNTYGHEDTLFAFELKKKKVNVKHIENPVIHKDIDSNLVFIEKTEMALQNLKSIYISGQISPNEIQLLKVYEKLKFWKLESAFTSLFIQFKEKMKNRLISNQNNLFLFNIYKLGYFCKINRR
ncbi:glycosyltransferase family 2 protein [Psychroflexus aestuariivivens]|uniref:glycosyltransferase family 2 protein n=1 Tax=Psychroflexus aestuariivivens TaxID=1795040 RepID=UPI000FD73222|nr:glycosyltransferase family 2 protein [Psychroflexus aestuariivivens]